MNSQDLRKQIQELICEYIVNESSDNTMPVIHQIIGVLEDLKIGLVTACHQASKEQAANDFKKDPASFEEYMKKHEKRMAELLKRAKQKDDTDETTSTTA